MIQAETATAPPAAPNRRPVFVLIAICVLVAVAGALAQKGASHGALTPPASPVPLYLSLIAMEWGLVLYVARAGLRGASLRTLIGGRWRGPGDVLRDGALALGAWALWTGVSFGLDRLGPSDHAASIRTLLPHGLLPVALWVALSLSAGFAEELVFRGYLMRELRAMTGSTAAGAILQSVVFGIAHGYQGVRAVLSITLFGLIFAALALRAGSLRPGMIAHAWSDVASGLWRI
jgi:membrane protease YdiL (CAAX protease family)